VTGLYGKGMHDFILSEAELGYRAAVMLDDEAHSGYGVPPAILDVQFEQYMREKEQDQDEGRTGG
jgi:hypothetical protein